MAARCVLRFGIGAIVRRRGMTSVASVHDDDDLPEIRLPIGRLEIADGGSKLSKVKETVMAKGQMKSNKEVKKPKKSVAEKSAGKGIVDVFAKQTKGGKK